MTLRDRVMTQMHSWDGRLILASIFIVGYFGLVITIATDKDIPATNIGLIRDALIVLGPPIGLIFGKLFETTAAAERRDAIRSDDFRAALETPGTPPASPRAVEAAVERGARAGTAEGVREAVEDEAQPSSRRGAQETTTAAGVAAALGVEPASTLDLSPDQIPVIGDE